MSGEIIRSIRKKSGVTLDVLAERTGISVPYLSRLESGARKLKADQISIIAEALGVQPGDLMELNFVPIVGKAGAGPDGAVLFALGDGNFGEVPAPTNSTPTTSALEVEGDSMTGIANDGWIITYDEKQDPSEEHIGEPCVCWLEDDRVLVKTPFPGRGPGLFDLESTSKPTMRDVPVRHMALVTNIIPRRSAEKWARREPSVKLVDVKFAS